MIDNKRGQMTALIFLLILVTFTAVIVIFIGGTIAYKINTYIGQDIDLGNVNLKNITDDTFGQVNTMMTNSADYWGLALIFGMVLGMFIASYITRKSYPIFGIIFDIFIIIACFFLAVYISNSFETIVNALGDAGETYIETYQPYSSYFLLHLPIFVVIIGVVAMVLFHLAKPRTRLDAYQEGGYLQGAY